MSLLPSFTAGNTEGLNTLLHAILDPGDEIILTDPGFPSHFQQIRLCGGVPIGWAMNEEDGWSLDLDGLRDLITERTKGIILVSPSNPTGKIFTERELRRIGDIALERMLLDEAKMTVTPGSAFGSVGEHHVRMAYCVDEATIETAFDRIEKRYPA